MNAAELTGQVRTHIAQLTDVPGAMHISAVAAFEALRRAARADGIDLLPVSSFRDFQRQLAIWNGKFSGERPTYDAAGRIFAAADLPPAERVAAILHWSALPGASRHHWGTDLDLVDRGATASDYRVQLTAEEFAPAGPYARLAAWLESHASRFGFFRPYRGIRSGVQPEPWHYSYAPIAELARRSLTCGVLREALEAAPLLGKEQVLARLEELHARYVARIDWP